MICAVVSDIGGVLHNPIHGEIIADIQQTLAVSTPVFDQIWSPLVDALGSGAIDEHTFWTQFCLQAQVTQPLPEESLWVREFARLFQPHSEVIGVIQALRQTGYRTAALSNTIAPHANFLRAQGIYEPFEVLILSYEVGLRKPDPAIFQLALEKLHIQPDEAVYIDDVAAYVDVARQLGMQGVVFRGEAQLQEDLRALGVESLGA